MRYFVLAITLLLFPSFSDAAVMPVDFAYGRPLLLKENGAVYRFEIPLEVYKTVSEKDLSDIKIFNSAEIAVPHMLRTPKIKGGISENTKALPFFPLYREGNGTGKNGLSLRIEKGDDGTIIDIESDNTGVDSGQKLSGYLIDISSHGMPVDALELVWSAGTEDFITNVILEHSNDLTRWRTLVSRSTIALKRFSGQEIVRKRIRFARLTSHIAASPSEAGGGVDFGNHPVKAMPNVKPKTGYLRLRWLSDSSRPELKEILAVQQTGTPQRERIWTVIDNIPKADDSRDKTTSYEYDSAAWLPVDRIRIDFPDKNTLARVKVFSKPDMESKWRYHQSLVLYRLEFGNTSLNQDTVHLGLSPDRYWRLELDGGSAGGLGKDPVVKLGWLPHELFFVAQGEGPFVMAYGSARLDKKELKGNSPELISRIIDKNENALTQKAFLSEKIVLGGPNLLTPLPPPLPWRDWLLWGVLVLGVGVIAKMAIGLFKNMENNR